jgi:hypothetical protein
MIDPLLNILEINFEVVMDFLLEFFKFLRSKKKLWLAPLILFLIVIGGLMFVAQGSVISPFIYTLF